MADQESADFTIVDRRSAANQASSGAESALPNPSEETPESPAASMPSSSLNDVLADPETATSEPVSSAYPDVDETVSSEDTMPDPALLLSMIGMQMETQALATALIPIFDGHAWRSMGLVANPMTGEAKKDLPSAQIAIDFVAFLLSKVESSLPESERRDAQRRLNDLRMNYVAKLREP